MSKPRKGVPFDDSNSSDKKQPTSMASLNGLPDFNKPVANRGFQGFDDGDNENSKKRGQTQKKQKNNKFGHRQEEAYGGEDGISEDIEQDEEQDNRIIE
jgi:hypothetical protein